MTYDFSITEFEAKALAGVKVRTSMDKAPEDCSALWRNLGPRLCAGMEGCSPGDAVSYGISTEMGMDGSFTYWAAIELPETAPLPEGMVRIALPGGPYVRCAVASLADLGPAFTAMYMEWPGTQTEYALNMNGACFEAYPANWTPDMPLEIYGALVPASANRP